MSRTRSSWLRFLFLTLIAAVWWPIVVLFMFAVATDGCVGPCPPRSRDADRFVHAMQILVVVLPGLWFFLARRWWADWFPGRPFPSFGRRRSGP